MPPLRDRGLFPSLVKRSSSAGDFIFRERERGMHLQAEQ